MSAVQLPVMLVTGGSGSIGRAIAEAAVAAGWAVVLHGRSEDSAEAAASAIRSRLGNDAQVLAIGADIVSPDAVETLVARAATWRDRLDAVVDCVSTGPRRKLTGVFAETDPGGYSGLMNLSVVHFERLAHASLPWLKRQGGTLIAFASDAGRYAAPRQALIGASRAAIIGFVRNLSTEIARDGVRVHCLCPSYVEQTSSFERMSAQLADRIEGLRGKAGLGLPTPADIAPLALFLCGDGARRISGQVISINGGANA